jgi:hypothetical protein
LNILSQEEVSRFFGARGVCRERLSQIETMKSVPAEIEIKYRATVLTAALFRDRARAAASNSKDFENLKMPLASDL